MPLKNRDSFYEKVLDYLQGDVAVLDAGFRYIYVNQYAIVNPEIRAWIIGKTDLEYCLYRGLDTEIAHRRRDKFIQAIESRKVVEWEERMINKDGEERVFLRRVFPVMGQSGDEVMYLIGHGLDITERRRYRDELEKNRRFTEAILNASPSLIFVKDSDGRFLMVNKAVADAFNLSPDGLINKYNSEVHTYADELQGYSEIDQEVIRSGNAIRIEESFTKPGGEPVWYDTVKVPLREQDGRVNVLGISTDITGRKRKEQQLFISQQQLAEAQELTGSGNWVRHLKDDSVEWSDAMFSIWGRNPELGSPTLEEVMNQILPSDRDKVYTAINRVMESGETTEFTYRVLVNGLERHMRSLAKAIHDEKGRIVSVFGSVADITDQVETEIRLRKNEATLNEAQHLARMGSYDLDLLTNKVIYSPGAFAIYEWDPDAPSPGPADFQKQVHPADSHLFDELWDLLPERRSAFETTFRFITTSGKLKYIKVVNQPERDGNDRLVRVLGTIADITDLKLTEEKLIRNEQRLNEAQSMARMGSFNVDLVSGQIEWSRGMYLIWELPEDEEITVEKLLSWAHPQDYVIVKNDIDQRELRNESWTIQYRIITPKGHIKHIESLSKIVQLPDGRGLGIVGSCQDITERKNFEEKLRLNEQRLFEAQELSRSGSWELTLRPEYELDWSPGSYKIWELAMDQPPPTVEEFYERVLEDDREKVKEAFRILFEDKMTAEVQFRVFTYDNSEKVFFSRGVPVLNAKGEVHKVYGTTADVTSRVLDEERLRQSEQSLVQAQKMAKLGSWYLHLHDYTIEWAEGLYYIWERDLNLPPPAWDELKSTIHEDDLEKFEETIMMAAQGEEEHSVEFRIRMTDSRIKTIEGRGRSIRNAAGQPVKLFGTVMDITRRKQVEEELIRARTQAELSSKAKEFFLANISHELRTPLNGIIGMSRLLQKTALNATQREYTEVLHQTAGNLLVIINDILDFAKIESGTLPVEDIVFDPARVADTAVQLQMFKAEEKDLVLKHLHEGPPLPKVLGDPYRLNQVLLNLLNNAIKYTNHGEVELLHRIMEESDSDVRVLFTIRDTGIGIPYEMQQEIFDSFTQVSKSDSPQGGIGLGLTISKSLVERLGGKIWVESQPDVGSLFHFYIPYKKATEEPNEPQGNTFLPVNARVVKILLVEDNKVNLFITEAMLQDWGFTVDVAGNGLEAVALCEKNDYDVVLMDIQMPEMNGLEATRVIRRIPDRKKSAVPIIAITANTSRVAHRQFLTEGMNDWIVKPFKEETLYKKIVQHQRNVAFTGSDIARRKFPQRRRPVQPSDKLYDLGFLRREDPSSPGFMKKMLTIFIDTIPGIVEKMLQHFEAGEYEAVSTLAHKIRPTIDGVGIHGLKEVIRHIEDYREKTLNTRNISS